GRVLLNTPLRAFRRRGSSIVAVEAGKGGAGRERRAGQVIRSTPRGRLGGGLAPPPPPPGLRAAPRGKNRAIPLVGLIINRSHLFPDNWIYIRAPEARVGRIQNFKNWSPDMAPDPARTCLGMEYFCTRGDDLWRQGDGALLRLAAREIEQLGLAR